MRRLAAALPALLALTSCIDSAGPRPRPGGGSDTIPDNTTPAALVWVELQPRVMTQGQTDTLRITAAVTGSPDVVQVITRSADIITFTRGTNGLYTAKIPPAAVFFGYHTGDLRNSVGAISVVKPGSSSQYSLYVNVRDATVPSVNPQAVANGVQSTPHVLNIRYDSIFAGGPVPTAPIKTLYDNFGDDFQFIALIEAVQSPNERYITLVRNQVRGIGVPVLDNGRAYGSDALLEAIVDYPAEYAFDLAETGNIHELAHRWMNYLRVPALASARRHWPLSDLANGIMGWDPPAQDGPLAFPYSVVPQSNGTYLLVSNDSTRSFNDLELYLMGLLPSDSVRSHIVFLNQNQRVRIFPNGTLQGTVDNVTIDRIIATEGNRIPAASAAPRQFRLATIVLSRGGLLSRNEMAFFELMASRGELQQPVDYFTGQARGTTLPFAVATGGRGTLSTLLRPNN